MMASSNQVLMQTATAVVKNVKSVSSVSILDSESQRSYITENLVKGPLTPLRNCLWLHLGHTNPKNRL